MQTSLIPSCRLQTLVESLAEFLRRTVVVNDPAVRPIYASRRFGDEQDVRIGAVVQRDGIAHLHEPHFVTGDSSLGLKDRYCAPLYGPGFLLGVLVIYDADRTLTGEQRAQIDRAGRDIAAQMYADALAADPRHRARRHAVLNLLGDNSAVRGSAAALLDELRVLPDASHVTVTTIVIETYKETDLPIDVALQIAVDTASPPRDHHTEAVIDGNRAVLVTIGGQFASREVLRNQATRVTSELQRVLGTAVTPAIGIGKSDSGRAEAWLARRRADTAARAVSCIPRIQSQLAFWDELGADAVLLQLPRTAPAALTIPDCVQALVAYDKSGKPVETLACFLDHAGSIANAAKALHLHRTSLYYRLEQIGTITGKNLNAGRDRLELHIGLSLLSLTR